METRTKSLIVLFGTMAAAVIALVMALEWQNHVHQRQVVQLQNQLAEKDKTIEVQKGLYTKLTVQTQDIQGNLDQRDTQVKELEAQVKKSGQELLDATTVAVKWKRAYEGIATATQTHVLVDAKDPPKVVDAVMGREKVDFHEDFGYIKVDGWTLTNPPQAWVRLSPGRPLRLTLALSQDSSKAWHTYVTSSEDNIDVDIQVTSVDPNVLQPKWYEKVGLSFDLGAGSNQGGASALVGLGLNYQFSQFTLGPHVWLGINDHVDKYYGLGFEWRPFQKK